LTAEYFNARSAAHRVGSFFLRFDAREPDRLDIGKIRELRDSLTLIDHYLWRRREQEINRLLNGFGDNCQIRDGNVGGYVSNNGAGRDYELPASQTDGQLIEVDSDGAKFAVVSQVACSSANDRGLINVYVKFDWAPDPYVATKFLSKCCLESNGLHFEVYDPLNYMAYVKLRFEIKEADLDNALLLIRQNIPKLISKVSEGMDLYIEMM